VYWEAICISLKDEGHYAAIASFDVSVERCVYKRNASYTRFLDNELEAALTGRRVISCSGSLGGMKIPLRLAMLTGWAIG